MTADANPAASGAELAQVFDQRATTYSMLSRLYRTEVDQAYLDALRANRYPAATGDANADEGYRLIARYLSNVHAGSIDELARDFVCCFVGEGMDSFSAAYPYESVHTSQKRLIMQDASSEVKAIMDSEGVAKSDDFREPEDHIAVELEFMQTLSQRTAEALRAGNEDEALRLAHVQRNFMADHLSPWVPMLTDAMRSFAKTGLYQGLAYLTDGFLASDKAFLAEVAADDDAGDAGLSDEAS